MTGCKETRALLSTFADGELAREQMLALEAHLESCPACAEQVSFVRALKHSIGRAVCADAVVSPDFERRLKQALSAEQVRVRAELAHRGAAVRRLTFSARAALGAVALAAAIALALGLRLGPTSSEPSTVAVTEEGDQASADELEADANERSIDQAIDRLIDYHSAPPQPIVTRAEYLPRFERNVGVRVRAPELMKHGATWQGANLVPIRNHQAAQLEYQMTGGRRVTVYVYNADKVPVHRRLERRTVHEEPVYLGHRRGYGVAAKERSGVGYALAGDLDEAMLEQLISSIH